MSLDFPKIQELSKNNVLARVVIVDFKGSAPRETGTSMLVGNASTFGTIGGGALEVEAIELGRKVIETCIAETRTYPLGPSLGQCCGGTVTIAVEPVENLILNINEHLLIKTNQQSC